MQNEAVIKLAEGLKYVEHFMRKRQLANKFYYYYLLVEVK